MGLLSLKLIDWKILVFASTAKETKHEDAKRAGTILTELYSAPDFATLFTFLSIRSRLFNSFLSLFLCYRSCLYSCRCLFFPQRLEMLHTAIKLQNPTELFLVIKFTFSISVRLCRLNHEPRRII